MIAHYLGGEIELDERDGELCTLQAAGQWEWRKVQYLQSVLRPGNTFVDAGAYNGYFTLIGAALVGKQGRVYAYEPDPVNWAVLRSNVQRNRYSWVLCSQAALADTEGKHRFYPREHQAWGSLRPNDNPHTLVTCKRLDNDLPRLPTAIKIDVEGMEASVLMGMENLLHQPGTCHILMDLHPELGVKPTVVERILKRHGFDLFDMRSDNQLIHFIPENLVELLAVRL